METPATGRTPRFVVIIIGYDNSGANSYDKRRLWVCYAVTVKLILPGDRLGIVYYNGNQFTSNDSTIQADTTSKSIYNSSEYLVSGTDYIALCLSKARDMISDHPNGIILLLCNGEKGADFVGAQNVDCKVPVHTFSMGPDSYDTVLKTIAARSGGTFSTLTNPWSSTLMSQLFDKIVNNCEDKPTSYPSSTREGLDLVCVLDKTYYRMSNAIEIATRFIMEKMTPMDRVSIIIYDEAASTYMPLRSMSPAVTEQVRLRIYHALDSSRFEGSWSNLKGGLETALQVINNRAHGIGRPSAIFLMCNGMQLPTVKPDGLVSNVPIHTFGFGDDADEEMLKTIASNSGGEFVKVPTGGLNISPGVSYVNVPIGDPGISRTFQMRLDAIISTLIDDESKSNAESTGARVPIPSECDDDEKPPAPNSGSNTAGLVTMKRPMYGKKNVALTADSVAVLVELNAASNPALREGLDLVVVLDVSNRMDMENMARMKNAMEFVIKKLTPTDRFCIVTFTGEATRHSPLRSMTAAAQTDLKAIIDGLKVPGGGSNIKSGLENAMTVVSSRKHTKGRTANIFLLSNGVQSTGDARLVDVGSVAVFTFGIGKDTDNVLLNTIARKSAGGTFSTVQDGADLTAPLAELLAGTLTVVAQDVQLTIRPDKKEKHLDTMVMASGLDYDQTADGADGKITIKFGALFSGETRKVVLDMKLRPAIIDNDDDDDDDEDAEDEDARLADVKISYRSQGDKDKGKAPRVIQIKRDPHPAPAAAGDRNTLLVLVELARRKYAKTIREARELADEGNLDTAKDMLMDALNDLENIMLDDGHKFVDTLRDKLRRLLDLMDNKALYNERGRPYALACETSHGRQRFAAKGDDSRSFATDRMETHREQAIQFVKDPTMPLPTADEDQMAASSL